MVRLRSPLHVHRARRPAATTARRWPSWAAVLAFALLGFPVRAQPAPALPGREDADVPSAVAVRGLVVSHEGVELNGSLYLPAGPGPFPAVVLLPSGAGDDRRDRSADAETFVAAGVAAYAFDQRGAGASQGTFADATVADLAGDGAAAVGAVRGLDIVDDRRVGVWGVGLGGWLLPWVARAAGPAFVVQVTAAATPLGSAERWRVGLDLARRGYGTAPITAALRGLRVEQTSGPLWARLPLLGDAWFASLDPALDPMVAWPGVGAPVLAFFGANDGRIPTLRSAALLAGWSRARGDTLDRVYLLDDAAHALGGSERNRYDAYRRPLTQWLAAVVGAGAPGRPAPRPNAPAPAPRPTMPTPITVAARAPAAAPGRAPANAAAGPVPGSPPASSDLSGRLFAQAAEGSRPWQDAAFGVTRWYAGAWLHLPVALAFVVVFLIGLLVSLTPRRPARYAGPWGRGRVDRGAPLVRLTQALVCLADLAMLGGLGYALALLLGARGAPPSPPLPFADLLRLGAGVSGGLALLLALLMLFAPSEGWRSARVGTAVVVAVAAALFLPFLLYWRVPFLGA